VTQNFAFLDFQASYALFSSVISATFVGPAEAVLSGVSSAFALFASTFPPHVARMKAAAAVRPNFSIFAHNFRLDVVNGIQARSRTICGEDGCSVLPDDLDDTSPAL